MNEQTCSSFMNSKRLMKRFWFDVRYEFHDLNIHVEISDLNLMMRTCGKSKPLEMRKRLSTLSVKRFITLATEYFIYLTWK